MSTFSNETVNESGKTPTNENDAKYLSITKEVSDTANFLVNHEDTEVVSLVVDFPIFSRYLYAIEESKRQYHNCRTCGKFFTTYAGLAVIFRKDTFFSLIPFLDDEFFRTSDDGEAMSNMVSTLRKAKVDSVFKTEERFLGTPKTVSPNTGEVWNHIYFDTVDWNNKKVRYSSSEKNEMAVSREAYKVIRRGYSEIKDAILTVAAIRDSLYRSEEITHMISVIEDLHRCMESTKNEREKELILWWFVSRFPSVCLHFRASVLYTLLYDVQSTQNLEASIAAFNMKMDPTKYKRVQAEATVNQVAAAFEKITELGYTEKDFKRTYFSKEDARKIPSAGVVWSSYRVVEKEKSSKNFFADALLTSGKEELDAAIKKKGSLRFFLDDIIDATGIWYLPRHVNPFFGMNKGLTGCKNIYKYESNVSHYCYTHGLSCDKMNIRGASPVNVLQITTLTECWGDVPNIGTSSMFLFFLEGVYDKVITDGTAIFPENLNKDLFPYRHVIENFSKKDRLVSVEYIKDQAAGVSLSKQYVENNPMTFIVLKNNIKFSYTLTSWE